MYDSIVGKYLDAGTYDAAALNTFFSTSVFNTAGAGSITVSAIPEPSTYAAFAGLLGLAVASVRRRKKA
jgi:hypothetical protein